MPESDDEKKFNEALKRMLKTPPKPHEKSKSPVAKEGVRKSLRKNLSPNEK